MTQTPKPRVFEMKKPAGHTPVIQRYSSQVEEDVAMIHVAVLGLQEKDTGQRNPQTFMDCLDAVFANAGKADHFDIATFTDDQGYYSSMAVCYWLNEESFATWSEKFDLWWGAQDAAALKYGLWFESFSVPPPYRETNAFKEYVRGLSACPRSKMKPMDESGYWGAARDRFAASAYDDCAPAHDRRLNHTSDQDTLAKRIVVTDIPDRLCVIRSGVTWENCGDEQLLSYERNLKPKLDAGMSFLRENAEETGCCSLRQVTCLDSEGAPQKEAYSLGIFLSYGHLERWAHDHPTHLAIYTRALAERKKYQEHLELLTYHEIYVLNDSLRFEYLNCHPETGLLPFFTNKAMSL